MELFVQLFAQPIKLSKLVGMMIHGRGVIPLKWSLEATKPAAPRAEGPPPSLPQVTLTAHPYRFVGGDYGTKVAALVNGDFQVGIPFAYWH